MVWGSITHYRKKTAITETNDSTIIFGTGSVDIPDDPMIRAVDNMTLADQSHQDVCKLMTVLTPSLATPKDEIYIGCWNVRMRISREINNYRCTILGLSEVRWTGFGTVKLTSGETIIFSGRDDDVYTP